MMTEDHSCSMCCVPSSDIFSLERMGVILKSFKYTWKVTIPNYYKNQFLNDKPPTQSLSTKMGMFPFLMDLLFRLGRWLSPWGHLSPVLLWGSASVGPEHQLNCVHWYSSGCGGLLGAQAEMPAELSHMALCAAAGQLHLGVCAFQR